MAIAVRAGREADIPRALELIKELAHFENAPAEVEVSVEEMLAWGFGKDQLFGFFVLEAGGAVVGLALYYYKYSTWKGKCLFLEDIIVTESERGKGYGKLLFDEVLKLAKAEQVRRMEWQVLDWNSAAIGFYKKYDPVLDPEWINCKLTGGQLQSL